MISWWMLLRISLAGRSRPLLQSGSVSSRSVECGAADTLPGLSGRRPHEPGGSGSSTSKALDEGKSCRCSEGSHAQYKFRPATLVKAVEWRGQWPGLPASVSSPFGADPTVATLLHSGASAVLTLRVKRLGPREL